MRMLLTSTVSVVVGVVSVSVTILIEYVNERGTFEENFQCRTLSSSRFQAERRKEIERRKGAKIFYDECIILGG